MNGLVRARHPEGGDVQARRPLGVDGGFDDGDVLAGDERDDVRGHDLIRDLDGKQSEGRHVLRRHDPDVRAGDGHDRSGAHATLAVRQRRHDDGAVGLAIGHDGRRGARRRREAEPGRAERYGKDGGECNLHRSRIGDLWPIAQRFSDQCAWALGVVRVGLRQV